MTLEIKAPQFISSLSPYLPKNETHCSKVGIYDKFLLYTIKITIQSSLMKDMWAELKPDASFKSHVSSSKEGRIKVQFICHAVNPLTIYKSPWNLEPWRPDLSLALTYYNRCNAAT